MADCNSEGHSVRKRTIAGGNREQKPALEHRELKVQGQMLPAIGEPSVQRATRLKAQQVV